jgi:hypothetical protein
MNVSSNILSLPNTLDSKSNKILMFDCLLLLGEELGDFYDQNMQILGGHDWLFKLGQLRNEYKLTLRDPDFVIKEPLKSDSPLRAVLPKSPTFYKNLDLLRRVRNQVAHNQVDGNYLQTREVLGVLLEVSLDVGLQKCINAYAGAIKRIEGLEQGFLFPENENIDARVIDFEDKSAEVEELLFEEKKKSEQVALLLEEARSSVVIKEIELEALYEIDQARTAAVDRMQVELDKARQEAETLRKELEDNERRSEELKKKEMNLKGLVESLASNSENIEILLTENSVENSKDEVNYPRTEKLMSRQFQEPGTPWTRPKGNIKIVLSVSSRDLTDTKNGNVLKQVDRSRSKALAEKWLMIRPQGGRVFIDSDGHATTLIDDRLIYLGNVTGLFD